MGTTMDARIRAMALRQIGLERLDHVDLASAATAAACCWAAAACGAGCDGRPCGFVTPENKNNNTYTNGLAKNLN